MKELKPESIREINRVQREFFNRRVNVFEPPLPEGVPDRLQAIVKAGRIRAGDRVLDVGTGSGILIHYMVEYQPSAIHACDLAENMLERARKNFPQVMTHLSDIRDLPLPERSLEVAFINGCFSNIMDKAGSLENLHRMLVDGGRLVISHPLGKDFIVELQSQAPFPLDPLPEADEARAMLQPHHFTVDTYVDEPEFYLLVALNHRSQAPTAEPH